jgi:MFS family permease
MSVPDGKRRLPLLPKVEVAVEGDEDRPPWHWSGFGAIGVWVLWAPLAFVVNAALEGKDAPLARIALNVVAFALASLGAGFLVGRFSGKAGRREATVAGVVAAAAAWALTVALSARGLRADVVTKVAWVLILAAITLLGAGAGRAGGALGVRLRKP